MWVDETDRGGNPFMTAVTLHRVDPARNMRRFYQLDVQPDLFGAWGVVREWGVSAGRADFASIPIRPLGRPMKKCSGIRRRSRAGATAWLASPITRAGRFPEGVRDQGSASTLLTLRLPYLCIGFGSNRPA